MSIEDPPADDIIIPTKPEDTPLGPSGQPPLFGEEEVPPSPLPTLPTRMGKDEMNLTDFPFALLADRAPEELKVLEFSDLIPGKGGKPIRRTWTVRGAEGLGLPLAFEESLYVVLMELTREQGFDDRTVCFSRYDLAKRLGLPHQGHSYKRVEEGLQRLSGVLITTKNAFWDPQARRYASVSFGILDEYVLYDEKPGRKGPANPERPKSSVTWNEILFKNMRAGYVKNLDVQFYLSLSSSISRRLYRYLDKKRYDGKLTFSIGLDRLAFERLGMPRNYYLSEVKRKLTRPHEELKDHGFLVSATFEKMKAGGEKVTYAFPGPSKPAPEERRAPLALPPAGDPPAPDGARPGRQGSRAKAADPLLEALIAHGMGKIVAGRLAREKREEAERQLAYLPYAQVKTTPGAYLRSAIEEGWGPPKGYEEAMRKEAKRKELEEKTEQKRREALRRKEAEGARAGRVAEVKARMSPEELEALEAEARGNVLAKNRAMARLAEQGKGGHGLEGLVKAELERLLLERG